jgi:diguanylate cyclase (GGDEF)-like protein
MRLTARPRGGRDSRLPSGPLAAALAAALVLLGSAAAIIAFQHASDERRVQQLLFSELQSSAAEQRQLELRALAARHIGGELERTQSALYRRFDLVAAAAAARASSGDPTLGRVVDRVGAFRVATDRTLAALAAGDARAAAALDRDRVQPAYAGLTAVLGAAVGDAGHRAEDAAAVARAGALAVLALAALLLVLIMLRLERARRAAHEAFYDPLTGLANRMLFGDRLRHALVGAERRGETLAVLFVDLDEFKAVNDTLGHAAGDDLLVRVAERAVETARTSDTVARLGGDEFAFLLERTAEDGAEEFAGRLVETLRRPIEIAGRTVRMDATIGCAVSAPGDVDADDLLRNADLAMYAGKRKGKGCFVPYEPSMYQALADRLEIESDLREAVGRGEISVVYQPIVEVGTGRLTAVEALARWSHPTRGLVPPSVFIPLAEETGVIRELGRLVLETACADARRWVDERPAAEPVGVTVNVSPVQLAGGDLADEVRRALESAGLDPRLLTLEITESVLVERGDSFVEELQRLSELGVRLAVDDFGTGYSSLSSLSRFPVDVLKIDRAFVVDVGHDESGQALVRSIVDLGRSLGLEAVAEGVEGASQVEALQDAGCGFGQGFHFAHPMDASGIDDLLGIEPLVRTAPRRRAPDPVRLRPAPGGLSAA